MTPKCHLLKKKVVFVVCTSPIELPNYPNQKFRCRKCLSCLITKRQEWSLRSYFELLSHKSGSFITLTFNEQSLLERGSYVNVRDLQLFFKRFRKAISPIKIRYVACGEYGDKTLRPHYHVVVFGYDFPDKKYLGLSKKGSPLYTSSLLSTLWPYGHVSIGNVGFASVSYVAGYTHGKIVKKKHNYFRSNAVVGTGEVIPDPFIVCSQGIGRDYVSKNLKQLFNLDFVVYEGKKYPLPEYFTKKVKDNLSENDLEFFIERRSQKKVVYSEEENKNRDYILKQKFSKR